MDRSDLHSLLEDLKNSFDYEKFRDSRKPVQSCDSFWVDTFHHYYIEDGKKGRDDLLFYVKLDSKQDSEIVEVLRRDSKSLPKRTDRGVLWEQTLYLNVLLHEFSYHVSSASLTVKPKSDSVDQVMAKVSQSVYPSPIERRMDSKGKVTQVAYPNIVFCIDNFEDIFSDIFTSKKGEKVAVQLLATSDRIRLEKLVFLGAIDHTTLMESVNEKEQVSLSTKLKKQLSLRSKSGKIYDTQSSYHFIQMRGPQLKGFAEMAVIRRDHSYLEQPGIFTTSVDSPSHISASHSDTSHSQSDPPDSHSTTIPSATDRASSANGKQKIPPTNSLAVSTDGGTSQGGMIQGGSYSPKLRQAFLGESSTAKDRASPVSRGSCSSQTGLLRSSSATRDDEEGEMSDNSDELFDHMTRSHGALDKEEDGGVVFKASQGPPTKYDKLADGISHQPTRTKFNSRESMKNLLQSFTRGSKKNKDEEGGDMMFAYLTYVQLPWYVLMEDILNGTKPKVL